MSSASSAEPATDGHNVTFADDGTINGSYGMTNDAFQEFLNHRGIPMASILTTRVGVPASPAAAANGSFFDIPCVPATTPTPNSSTAPPRFGP